MGVHAEMGTERRPEMATGVETEAGASPPGEKEIDRAHAEAQHLEEVLARGRELLEEAKTLRHTKQRHQKL